MSKESAVQFLEAVAQPPALEEFQTALNDSIEALVALGERKGFSFEGQELSQAIAELMKQLPSPETLSEQELESVVGGARMATSNNLKQIGIALHNYDESLTTDAFWSFHGY